MPRTMHLPEPGSGGINTTASGRYGPGCTASWCTSRWINFVGETDVIGAGDLGGDTSATTAVSPDGTAIFLWNPTTRVLTRVDLTTGEASTGTGDVTADAGGPLGALGRWLTPTAAAKVLLSSGIAISPDGTRIYALGIESNVTAANGGPGSAGVFIFDTANLRQLAHWEATADFVSLAVSADARFVYAAGSPQFNVGGTVTGQEASITVFDARDGSVRLIAGQLGRGFLLFPSTIVQQQAEPGRDRGGTRGGAAVPATTKTAAIAIGALIHCTITKNMTAGMTVDSIRLGRPRRATA